MKGPALSVALHVSVLHTLCAEDNIKMGLKRKELDYLNCDHLVQDRNN
jgi:hypothetical protein